MSNLVGQELETGHFDAQRLVTALYMFFNILGFISCLPVPRMKEHMGGYVLAGTRVLLSQQSLQLSQRQVLYINELTTNRYAHSLDLSIH